MGLENTSLKCIDVLQHLDGKEDGLSLSSLQRDMLGVMVVVCIIVLISVYVLVWFGL